MLFAKEVTKITYQDVVEFCKQRFPESIHLDYKQDFPSDLEKTISAFANTMGGLIIIGVEEEDSKPKLPVKGITHQEGLRERVNNIILSNIYPPVFPEIQVCEPVDNKTSVVIRIPESHMTPHYIRHRTQIYIRTDDVTKPEKLAPKEQIEWLIDKREKSEKFQEFLTSESEDYFKGACRLSEANINDPQYFGIISLRAIPLFPKEAFCDYADLNNIENEIVVGRRDRFPYFINRCTPIQNGIHNLTFPGLKDGEKPSGHSFQYVQVNAFGLYLYKEEIGQFWKVEGEEQERRVINYYNIVELVHYFLASVSKFYQKIGFWGLLLFQLELSKTLGLIMPHPLKNRANLFLDQEYLCIPKEEFKWEREISASELKENVDSFSIDILRDVAWSLGARLMDKEKIQKIIENNFPV